MCAVYCAARRAVVGLLLVTFIAGIGNADCYAQSATEETRNARPSNSIKLFSGSTQREDVWKTWVNRVGNVRKFYTIDDLNLRAGPSTRHRTMTTMPFVSRVWVTKCGHDWCHLFYISDGGTGFAGYAPASWIGTWADARDEVLSTALDQKYESSENRSYPREGDGYINEDGNWVPSPQYSNDGVPAGAIALCDDGTYSFSRNRRGTCSHHGGVASWLR